jgi:hypothetical protein
MAEIQQFYTQSISIIFAFTSALVITSIPAKISPERRKAIKLPPGIESPQIDVTSERSESGNHLLAI